MVEYKAGDKIKVIKADNVCAEQMGVISEICETYGRKQAFIDFGSFKSYKNFEDIEIVSEDDFILGGTKREIIERKTNGFWSVMVNHQVLNIMFPCEEDAITYANQLIREKNPLYVTIFQSKAVKEYVAFEGSDIKAI